MTNIDRWLHQSLGRDGKVSPTVYSAGVVHRRNFCEPTASPSPIPQTPALPCSPLASPRPPLSPRSPLSPPLSPFGSFVHAANDGGCAACA